MSVVTTGSHLIVPIKPLHLAKTRLRAAGSAPAAHAALVTSVALDTVEAARAARGVAEVVVVTSDARLTGEFAAMGVEVLPDTPSAGLNEALRHADALLRARAAVRRVGALQADLPALRPEDLADALGAAGDDRSYCPDRQGTGTTLLLAEPCRPLEPRFGVGSSAAHERSGAKTLHGPWDSLRCDVDTSDDLRAANRLGLGPRTARLVRARW
ncbi:2-phospho-L-lactate guanylyltransferase [Saccharopolyspora erythraea]|nr:2-phospho-L-lactate guanylyltransferase [Saccharopolyspora erythraea]